MAIVEEYNEISSRDRAAYETRAEEFAKFTLPYIFVDDSFSGSSETSSNYSQSLGGRLVQSLASKMAMTLVPAAGSSFKFVIDPVVEKELTQGDAKLSDEVRAQLSNVVGKINDEIEAQEIRRSALEMLLHLLVVGSCVIEKIPKGGIKVHNLKSFVVKLDKKFNATKIILKEILDPKTLPEGITVDSDRTEDVELYTKIEIQEGSTRNKITWVMTQEIEGEKVGTETTYSNDDVPFQYLGWFASTGDKFHRPKVEESIDDLKAYEALANLLTKGSIIAAKSITLVDEQRGRTRKIDLEQAEDGAIINGKEEDISSFQHNKSYDFRIAQERMAELKNDLEADFLATRSVTRDAERVTAQEIQIMAQELETSLTGVYSMLASKFSRKNVVWIMKDMGVKFKEVSIKIIVGLDALGRSFEAQRLDAFMSRINALGMAQMVNMGEVARRYAEYEGIDTKGLLKTEQELQQEQAARMQQFAQEKMLEAGANQASQLPPA